MKSAHHKFFQTAQKVLIKFWHDNCLERAATLTYVTILSLVPITTVSFSILGRFKLSESKIRAFLLKYFLPESSLVPIIEHNIEKFIKNTTTLSIIGTIALLFISFAVLTAIEATFNRIWQVQKRRSYFNKFVSFWTVLTLTPLLLGTSLSFITRIEHLSFSPILISFLLSTTGLFFLYRLFPYTEVSLKAAFIGSAIASTLFETCKWGFKYYIHYYASFDKIYGALGVIPIFLVWLYWTWLIVLLGAEIAFICDYPYTPPRKKSPQYNPMWPIFILLEIMHNFQKEKKRLNNKDLAQRLNLPLDTINFLTNYLATRRWITRTENETWVPNCPLENLTLREIVSVNKEFTKIGDTSIQKIESIWQKLEVCLEKEWGNTSLRELIQYEQ
ncbi:MAG: YihY family inner membrane protein [Candidatus Desulfofervidaceae bacterium]|nr:YihY family inner membrane protein [Candidatus Desulfofervidaceae bacterium]